MVVQLCPCQNLTVLQMPCSAFQRLASAVWLFINHSFLTGLGAAHSCHTGPLGPHPAQPSWKQPELPEGPVPTWEDKQSMSPSSLPAATAEPETQIKEFPPGLLLPGTRVWITVQALLTSLTLYALAWSFLQRWRNSGPRVPERQGGQCFLAEKTRNLPEGLDPGHNLRQSLLSCRFHTLFQTIVNHSLLFGTGHTSLSRGWSNTQSIREKLTFLILGAE